jgi:hypothetical protein
MKISEQQHKAAEKIFELIATELGKNRAVHPATVIASAARLAGSFMFRSFNFQLANASPGSAVLSEEANEKFPALINLTGSVLINLGIDIDQKKLNDISMEESNLNFLDTLNLLQSKAAEIMGQNKLDYEQMAYSCAMATAFLIKECQQDLVTEAGFNTAIYSFIEGSKTYPPELTDAAPRKKSIFSFWK